jgi:hypothetical protein
MFFLRVRVLCVVVPVTVVAVMPFSLFIQLRAQHKSRVRRVILLRLK